MTLASKIVDMRKQSGMTQEQLAADLGVSRQTVSKWELGTAIPDTVHIIALSRLFDVTTDYLLTDSAPSVKEHMSKYPRSLSKIEALLLEKGYLLGYSILWREFRGILGAAVIAWIYLEAISIIGIPIQQLPFQTFLLPIAAATVALLCAIRIVLILFLIHKIKNLDQD